MPFAFLSNLYHLKLTSVFFTLLIIVHANQKNFTGIILQAIQIVLLLDLLHYYTTAEGKKQLFHIQKAPDFPTT